MTPGESSLSPLAYLLRLAGLVLLGMILALAAGLSCRGEWYRRPGGRQLVRGWMRALAATLGLRIQVFGAPAPGPLLLCANHVSWLDVVALNATLPLQFVAKAEVSRWPLLGWLAAASGTLFLPRYSPAGLRGLMVRLETRLGLGGAMAIFPEGTSTDGRGVKSFYPALFQVAVSTGGVVQAVAIRYGSAQAPDTQAAFLGREAFLGHLPRIARRSITEVELVFCPPVEAQGRSRQLLARYTRSQIEQALIPLESRAVA